MVKHLGQGEGLAVDADLPGLGLGEIQDVVDDTQQCLARFANVLHHHGLAGGQRLPVQQLGQSEDGVHGRADFVAHVGEKFALGPGGGLGGFLGGNQGQLGLFLGRHVAGDVGNGNNIPVFIAMSADRAGQGQFMTIPMLKRQFTAPVTLCHHVRNQVPDDIIVVILAVQ